MSSRPIKTRPYPLDPSQYRLGDIVPREDIEEAFGVREEDDPNAYRRKMMEMAAFLEGHFSREVGRTVALKYEGSNLRILRGGRDQLEYAAQRWMRNMRDQRRSADILAGVDRLQLTTEDQRTLDRFMERVSKVRQFCVGYSRRPALPRRANGAAEESRG